MGGWRIERGVGWTGRGGGEEEEEEGAQRTEASGVEGLNGGCIA